MHAGHGTILTTRGATRRARYRAAGRPL